MIRLLREGKLIRVYHGSDGTVKGGLIDDIGCVNTTDRNLVLDNAVIRRDAWISGNAIVKDDAVLENWAHAGHNVIVSGGSHLSGPIFLGKGYMEKEAVLVIHDMDIYVHPSLFVNVYEIACDGAPLNHRGLMVSITPRLLWWGRGKPELHVTVARKATDKERYKVTQGLSDGEIGDLEDSEWEVHSGGTVEAGNWLRRWMMAKI